MPALADLAVLAVLVTAVLSPRLLGLWLDGPGVDADELTPLD